MTSHRNAKALAKTTDKTTEVRVLPMPRLQSTAQAARNASRPVWVTVVAEALVVLAGLGLAGWWAYQLAAGIDTSTPPPYEALALFPMIGAVARLARLSHVGRALHRWHGHLLRVIDQRFARDLEPDPHDNGQVAGELVEAGTDRPEPVDDHQADDDGDAVGGQQ